MLHTFNGDFCTITRTSKCNILQLLEQVFVEDISRTCDVVGIPFFSEPLTQRSQGHPNRICALPETISIISDDPGYKLVSPHLKVTHDDSNSVDQHR